MTDAPMDKIEEIARAMTAKRVELLSLRLGIGGIPGWDEYTDEGKADAIEEARAAYEVMASSDGQVCPHGIQRFLRCNQCVEDDRCDCGVLGGPGECEFCERRREESERSTPDGFTRDHPDSRYFWHHGSQSYSRFPGEHTRRSWEPVGRASLQVGKDLPDD